MGSSKIVANTMWNSANALANSSSFRALIPHGQGMGSKHMTAAESKSLKTGGRVYWQGRASDKGVITATSWDAVTITWDNGHVATVHHGDMREIHEKPTNPRAEQGAPNIVR
jgi:hypothetical protein